MRHFRQLLHSPAFTLPAVLGLALGIGATTAVYSVFSAMLLRSIGVDTPNTLVALWRTDPEHGQKHVEVSYADLLEWRKATDLFSGVALASSVNLDFPLFASAQPEHVDGTTVSGNFFLLLGATPLAGRFFTDDDDRPGAPLRIVISHRLWRSRFGGDYGVIGRQLRVGAGSVTVIGVTRPEFDFPRDVDIWSPLRASWPSVEKTAHLGVFRSVARLRPGIGPRQANAHLAVIARQMDASLPPGAPRLGAAAVPMLDEVYGAARPAIWILLGAVAVVLLIACGNTANLLLARGAERSREIAVRAALGAERGQLARMLLGESAAIGAAAGLVGLALAYVGVKVLVALAPAEVPRIADASVDTGVLLFGCALTALTVLIFGVAPAITGSRRDPVEAMSQGGRRTTAGRSRRSARAWLIAIEVAMSAFLLVGAGLLLRSFANMTAVDPGFKPDRILTFRITLEKADQESRRASYTQVLEKLRALPGVESAAAVLLRPLSGPVGWDTVYRVEGQSPQDGKSNPNGNYQAVSPEYFRTMGIRLAAGRDFTAADTHTTEGVVIVNESTARRHWPQAAAVGKRVRLSENPNAPWLTVVGIAGDVRYREWEAARPDFYIPYTQRAQHRSDFVVKTHAGPGTLAAAVRREVFAVDPDQPISNVTTMEALVDRALARSRFNSLVMTVLAACALLLAAIGVYGLLSFSVLQRTSEIGVRMALGASPAGVAQLVTAGSLKLVTAGALTGIAAAAALSSVIATQLYGVTGLDAAAYLGALALLLAITLAASLLPALRAARIEPARALQRD